MDITITLHRDELVQALGDFLPMRLMLGARNARGGPVDADPAWIEVVAFDTVTYVPGRGLTLTCAARVHYPLPIVPDDFVIQHLALAVVPRIMTDVTGQAILAFAIDIADIDIQHVPAFVDRVVANRINATLREHVHVIAWDFTHTLTRIIHLPERFERVRALELASACGTLEWGETAAVLRIGVEVRAHHDDAPVPDA